MNAKRSLDQVKKKLLDRKKELEEILLSLASEKIDTDPGQDIGDQVASAVSQVLRDSLESNEAEEYKRVMRALKAINEDNYGTCVDCELPISEKRLTVYPYASRCIACQEAYEK